VKWSLTLGLLLLTVLGQATRGEEQQRLASIGDLKLESGGVIRDCVIGYHT